MRRTAQITMGLLYMRTAMGVTLSAIGNVDDPDEDAAIKAAMRWIGSLPAARVSRRKAKQ